MDNMKEKEHYIPRFFLKRFADDKELLYVYDVEQDKTYEGNYKAMGYINNLYETKFKNANPCLGKYVLQNDIENILADNDGEFASFLHNLDKIIIPNQYPDAIICNKIEKKTLIRFIVNLMFRHPSVIKLFETEENINSIMAEEEVINECNALDLMGLGGGESVVRAAFKKAIVTEKIDGGLAKKFIDIIDKIPFVFYFNEFEDYVISDIPVAYGRDRFAKGDDICMFVPLCSRYAVLFGNYENIKKNKLIYLNEKQKDYLNYEYIRNSVDYKNRLYFRSCRQREEVISKIKEGYYAKV